MRQCTDIHESQFGFMPGRSTTDAIFILKQTIEKHREGQKNIRVTFIDLEKTYDSIPREEKLEVGLHQGSALSPYMFLLLMDVLTEDVIKDVPGSMMFADDIVLCGDDEPDMTEYLEI